MTGSSLSTSVNRVPQLLTKEQNDRLSSMLNKVQPEAGIFVIPSTAAPTDVERASLEKRSKALAFASAAMDRDETVATIAMMMETLKRRNSDADEMTAVLLTYHDVLKDQPAWAVRVACSRFVKGDSGDGEWMPTPAQIRKDAMSIAKPFDEEQAKIRKLLSAKVVNEGGKKTPAEELLKPFRDNWNPTVRGQQRDERDFQPKGRVPLTADQFKENVASLKSDWAARDAAAGGPVKLSQGALRAISGPSLTNYGDGRPRGLPGKPEASE